MRPVSERQVKLTLSWGLAGLGPIDALWHLLNLFAPAAGLGLIASSLAKLLWRRALQSVAWSGLVRWTVGANAGITLLALVLQWRDGRMATYAAMVLVTALLLWWRGWMRA